MDWLQELLIEDESNSRSEKNRESARKIAESQISRLRQTLSTLYFSVA